MHRIAIIMTCHNRINKTKESLESLSVNNTHIIDFFITDDNSTDGTLEMLHKFKSQYRYKVNLMYGTGNLFWCRGMKISFDEALKDSYDFYLWVNDDVVFYKDFIDTLISAYDKNKYAGGLIIVGSCKDSNTGKFTYGGVKNIGKQNRLKYKFLEPSQEVQECDTINGNCVLIDKKATEVTGSLESRYEHGMGDFDYGHRAKKEGVKIYVAPNYVGTCSRNEIKNTWKDTNLSLRERLNLVKKPNGLPYKSWLLYTSRFGGSLWIIHFIKPYIKILLTSNVLFRKSE